MAHIDQKRKRIQGKIVYYGPGLCGKTTNLEQINGKLSSAQELMSLSTRGDRTIFFDFLPMDQGQVGDFRTSFKLYTVPGQVRYNQTRKMVLKNVDGVVFVADSQARLLDSNLDSFNNLFENLVELGVDAEEIAIVLQYNKRDLTNILPKEALDAALNNKGYPVFLATAINGEGVVATFERICALVTDRLLDNYGRPLGEEGRADAGVEAGPVFEQEEAGTDEDKDPVYRIRLSDLEQMPSDELYDRIQLSEVASKVGRLVTQNKEATSEVTSSVDRLKEEIKRDLPSKADFARVFEQLEQLREDLRHNAASRDRYSWAAWLAEVVITHADEILLLLGAEALDRAALLDQVQRLRLAAEEILGTKVTATLHGIGREDLSPHAAEAAGVDAVDNEAREEEQRKNAARVARVMVADLYLYYKSEVDQGIKSGDFSERFKTELSNMRATYESRVSEEARRDKDYLQLAIDELLERKGRELANQ